MDFQQEHALLMNILNYKGTPHNLVINSQLTYHWCFGSDVFCFVGTIVLCNAWANLVENLHDLQSICHIFKRLHKFEEKRERDFFQHPFLIVTNI